MRNLVFCVVVLGALCAGCDKKAKAGEGSAASPPAAAEKVATTPVADKAAAPAAAKADAGPCDQLGSAVKEKVPASHAANTSAIVECMVDLCNADKWSSDVITCVEATPFDAKACQAKLTTDQFQHLDTAIQAEFGSDGPTL